MAAQVRAALHRAQPRVLWADSALDHQALLSRPPLTGSVACDVAIVGAGFTGLWTAYALALADPGLRITVLEANSVGSGASGKNGGWASALLPVSLRTIAASHGHAGAVAQSQLVHSAATELRDWIDAHNVPAPPRGGMVYLARSEPQGERLRSEVAEFADFGLGDDDYRWLDSQSATRLVGASNVRGALYSPHCAAIQPRSVVDALAAECLSRGVDIHEHTRVESIEPRRLHTHHGEVRAQFVVRATEAFTPALAGRANERRAVAPIFSLVVATEPLTAEQWNEIGLASYPCFADGRRAVIYGQRTLDNRLVFGGRGAPYHFGSRTAPRIHFGSRTAPRIHFGSRTARTFDQHGRTHRAIVATLWELFPSLVGTPITHTWGGAVAVARDWYPRVSFDPTTGIATAGGYAGDGVTLSYLAGHTVADLLLGRDTDRTQAPFAQHSPRAWEHEPVRWLGINAGVKLSQWADSREFRRDRPARVLQAALDRLGA